MGRLRDSLQAKTIEEVKPVEKPKPVVPPEEPKVEVKAEPKPVSPPKEEPKVEAKAKPKPTPVKVKTNITGRWWMISAAIILILVGLGGFWVFMGNQNMVVGVASIACILGGGILIYYWYKGEDKKVQTIGTVATKQVNCLNIYRDRIVFEDWAPEGATTPLGFPKECLNDHKKYYVNLSQDIYNIEQTGLEPFRMPDVQYFDPQVFAERVIELPAHRRVMRRREKIAAVIKTILLVVVIIILFILILTTTGQKPTPS